jgi:hypothetical protein
MDGELQVMSSTVASLSDFDKAPSTIAASACSALEGQIRRALQGRRLSTIFSVTG